MNVRSSACTVGADLARGRQRENVLFVKVKIQSNFQPFGFYFRMQNTHTKNVNISTIHNNYENFPLYNYLLALSLGPFLALWDKAKYRIARNIGGN